MTRNGQLKATMVIFKKRETIDENGPHDNDDGPHVLETIRTTSSSHGEKEPAPSNNGDLIEKLITQYGDQPSYSKLTLEETDLLRSAFGHVADQILKTDYDGSSLVTDTRQDLLGEQYLARQIKKLNEENRHRSILDTYNYMLYEGDRTRPLQHRVYPMSQQDLDRVKPIKTSYFRLADLMV